MDFYTVFIFVLNIASILMSIVALKRVDESIDLEAYYYCKNKREVDEMKEKSEKEQKVTTKITSYEQAVKDILETLPKGSAKVIDEPIDNTVVIRIQKKCIYGGITMELTLYLENGKTLRFENVTNLEQESYVTSLVTFNYVSASDGKKKRAIFSFNSLIGLSVDKEDFDVNSLF